MKQPKISALNASRTKFRTKGRRSQTRPSEGANFDVKMRFFVTSRTDLISTWKVEVVVAHLLHSLYDPLTSSSSSIIILPGFGGGCGCCVASVAASACCSKCLVDLDHHIEGCWCCGELVLVGLKWDVGWIILIRGKLKGYLQGREQTFLWKAVLLGQRVQGNLKSCRRYTSCIKNIILFWRLLLCSQLSIDNRPSHIRMFSWHFPSLSLDLSCSCFRLLCIFHSRIIPNR